MLDTLHDGARLDVEQRQRRARGDRAHVARRWVEANAAHAGGLEPADDARGRKRRGGCQAGWCRCSRETKGRKWVVETGISTIFLGR